MFKIRKPTNLVDSMGNPTSVGDWKRQKELGSGAFGVVHLWVNKNKGDCLAIKKCKWNLTTNLTTKQRERWTIEVEMMKKIKNGNIVTYRSMPEELEKALMSANLSGLPILSMEYCSLGNLRTVLNETTNCCGLPEQDVLYILNDISNALMCLHNLHITHRDVKPENIVLQHCLTRKKPIIYKLIDLGYAKELGDETVSFVGTLQYLAPEIFTKQKYNEAVDYWSFGITAFEVICGIRPFLPAFATPHCIPYLEKKPSDVIAIQMTHTGDIESFKEMPKENHLNVCLKLNLEKWFKSVLQYDAQKRGLFENNNTDVFKTLQSIATKRIITVFSVYAYEFYSYEVNKSTLFATLKDWIERDTKIQKADLFVATTKICDSIYAVDYYDEANPESMIFVFKKNAAINNHVRIILPKLIKILFNNQKTEFKFGTLKLLHVQVIYLIMQERKHVEALKNAICYQNDCLKNIFDKEQKLFFSVKTLLQNFLTEIEFYNKMEISLFVKVYKDTNNIKLKTCLSEYLNYMQQLQKIINLVNTVAKRHNALNAKNGKLQRACNIILDTVGTYDFDNLHSRANQCYEGVVQQAPVNVIAGSELFRIITTTIKIRNILLDNKLMAFLKCTASFWNELNKLLECSTGIQNHLITIRDNVREIMIQKLNLLQEVNKDKGLNTPNSAGITGMDLIVENTELRYNFQEFMDMGLLKHKTVVNEINKQSALNFALENGFGEDHIN